MQSRNIFKNIPTDLTQEFFETILTHDTLRIERIVSYGQHSPKNGWYDQNENEWVMLVKGEAILLFEDNREIALQAGEYINIPAHTRHRVSWTKENTQTIWLAVFY